MFAWDALLCPHLRLDTGFSSSQDLHHGFLTLQGSWAHLFCCGILTWLLSLSVNGGSIQKTGSKTDHPVSAFPRVNGRCLGFKSEMVNLTVFANIPWSLVSDPFAFSF
jgi:hypothetical protein